MNSHPPDTPGSPSAFKKGCTCPIMDNAGGEGYRPEGREDGAAIFWISDDCQLHAPKNAGEILEKLSQEPVARPREVKRLNKELLAKDER